LFLPPAEAKMLTEEEWLYLVELVKKESYRVYWEDFEDTIQENLVYCAEKINFERKRPGRRKKITCELVRSKIANRLRTCKAKYRRERLEKLLSL
jgi:hypothetical protein